MSEDRGTATRFVILAAPRSGSNFLCSLLNSHAEILCHHEVYNPSGIFYALDRRDGSLDLGTVEERDQAPLAFLERLWSATLGRQCVGFKMTRGQNEHVLEEVLRDPGVRKIVLHRRNRIKTYVSTLVAERSGQWEVYREADLVEPGPKLELNVSDLRTHIATNETYYVADQHSLAILRPNGSGDRLRRTGQAGRTLASTRVPRCVRAIGSAGGTERQAESDRPPPAGC